jgi:cytochrome c oxidase subunit II
VRKSLIIQLLAIAVVVGAIAFVLAFWIDWLPPLASKQGGRIDDVYVATSIICLVIFALVAAVSIYAVLKFRARPDDDEDGKPIHGHTGIEILWTAIPTALVIFIGIYSGVVLVKNEQLPDGYRTFQVKAVQFEWSFTYPDEGVDTPVYELHLPLGETVKLELQSDDVIHSFWVPELRVKQDVVPGTVQRYIVTPTRVGRFPLICTELCGIGHSTMRSWVVVEPPDTFDAWLEKMKNPQGQEVADAKSIFVQNCGSCHMLAAAGTTGTTGPDLDTVVPDMSQENILDSIVDPNAVITPGYEPNLMPQNFGETLSDEQLNTLVAYLQEVAGK